MRRSGIRNILYFKYANVQFCKGAKFVLLACSTSFCILAHLQIFKLLFMWKEENNKLYKKYTFKNFSEAFAFMTRVAIEAERMDHHPTWTNTWNAVEIWLNTHSAGNTVTDKDRELAKKIDSLLS